MIQLSQFNGSAGEVDHRRQKKDEKLKKHPASTGKTMPVVQDEYEESKKAAAAALSSGFPKCGKGCALAIASSISRCLNGELDLEQYISHESMGIIRLPMKLLYPQSPLWMMQSLYGWQAHAGLQLARRER
jgi:hypothetical protein